MEIWKDIENYSGYYQISSYGRVRNVKTGNILTGDINNMVQLKSLLMNIILEILQKMI